MCNVLSRDAANYRLAFCLVKCNTSLDFVCKKFLKTFNITHLYALFSHKQAYFISLPSFISYSPKFTAEAGGAKTLQLSSHEGKAKALIHMCRHESSTESTMLLFTKTTETPTQSVRISPHRTHHMFSANMTSWLPEWKIAQRPQKALGDYSLLDK